MAKPHVTTALIAQRAELPGEFAEAARRLEALRQSIEHVDHVLALFGYGRDPDAVPPHYKRPPRMFRNGQLKRMIYDVKRECPELAHAGPIAAEIVRRMGWHAGNPAVEKPVAVCVRRIRLRMGILGEAISGTNGRLVSRHHLPRCRL